MRVSLELHSAGRATDRPTGGRADRQADGRKERQDTRQKLYTLIMQTLVEEQSKCDGNEKAKEKAKEKPKKKPKKRDAWHRGKAWQKGEKGRGWGRREL